MRVPAAVVGDLDVDGDDQETAGGAPADKEREKKEKEAKRKEAARLIFPGSAVQLKGWDVTKAGGLPKPQGPELLFELLRRLDCTGDDKVENLLSNDGKAGRTLLKNLGVAELEKCLLRTPLEGAARPKTQPANAEKPKGKEKAS